MSVQVGHSRRYPTDGFDALLTRGGRGFVTALTFGGACLSHSRWARAWRSLITTMRGQLVTRKSSPRRRSSHHAKVKVGVNPELAKFPANLTGPCVLRMVLFRRLLSAASSAPCCATHAGRVWDIPVPSHGRQPFEKEPPPHTRQQRGRSFPCLRLSWSARISRIRSSSRSTHLLLLQNSTPIFVARCARHCARLRVRRLQVFC